MFLVDLIAEILHEDVREFTLSTAVRPLIARREATDEDLLVGEQHAVDFVDRAIGCFLRFEMNETEAFRLTVLIGHDLRATGVGGESEWRSIPTLHERMLPKAENVS